MAISGLPSPSKSPMTILIGYAPDVKSTLGATDVASIICELEKVTLKGTLA